MSKIDVECAFLKSFFYRFKAIFYILLHYSDIIRLSAGLQKRVGTYVTSSSSSRKDTKIIKNFTRNNYYY